MANGDAPKVGYFGEFDINNVMFTQTNYKIHIDLMRKYRFLNMFVSEPEERALRPENVVAEAA
jgi:hypothetical protein